MALRELLAVFSVDTGQAETALKKVDEKIEGAKSALGGLAEAFIGSAFVAGMTGFVAHQIEAGSRVNDLSEKLGIGTEELQKFQLAAGLAGVESESAAQALGFLNKNMGEALDGNKEAAETFQKLGIALKDNGGIREVGDLIPELADSFAALGSNQERTALAMKVFGKSGAALIPLLKGGSASLAETYERFQQLGGGMSDEFVKAADDAGDQIDLLKFGLNSWKSKLALEVLPVVSRWAVKLQDGVIKLHKLTKETNLAKYAAATMGVASAAASAKAAMGFGKMLGVLPKDGSFWSNALGLGKIALVAGAALLLALAFEDVYTFIKGGDSVIGHYMEELFGAEAAAEFADSLREAWELVSQAFDNLKGPLGDVGKLFAETLKDSLPYIVTTFEYLVRVIATLAVGLASVIAAAGAAASAVAGVFKGDNTKMDNLGGTLGDIFGKGGEAIFGKGGLLGDPKAVEANAEFIGPPRAAKVRQPTGFARGDANVTQSNQVNVTVQGGKNAQETGKAVAGGVREALGGDLAATFAALNTGG
jgi:hypothetical protein